MLFSLPHFHAHCVSPASCHRDQKDSPNIIVQVKKQHLALSKVLEADTGP
jgi:hypothetical protein